jgi:hypothetical protein
MTLSLKSIVLGRLPFEKTGTCPSYNEMLNSTLLRA